MTEEKKLQHPARKIPKMQLIETVAKVYHTEFGVILRCVRIVGEDVAWRGDVKQDTGLVN